MNQKLSNEMLSQVCTELLRRHPGLSCRRLRGLLRARFGCSCRTDRVYALWRSIRAELERHSSETAEPSFVEQELTRAQQQVASLETALSDAEGRAHKAEERERIHQDRWALEIAALREEVRRLRTAGWRI